MKYIFEFPLADHRRSDRCTYRKKLFPQLMWTQRSYDYTTRLTLTFLSSFSSLIENHFYKINLSNYFNALLLSHPMQHYWNEGDFYIIFSLTISLSVSVSYTHTLSHTLSHLSHALSHTHLTFVTFIFQFFSAK